MQLGRSLVLSLSLLLGPALFAQEAAVLKPLDPELRISPGRVNDATRVYLALFKSAKKNIREASELTDAEKTARLEALSSLEKQLLAATDVMAKYSPLFLSLDLCGGAELSLGFMIPNRIHYLTPGGQFLGCVTLAFTRNAGTGNLNVPVFGVSSMGGAQVQRPEKDAAGRPVNGMLEPQGVLSFKLPLNQKAPMTKVGDLQGYYVGGSVHWAFETNSKMMENVKSGAISPYVKVDGWSVPEVLMINITSTKSQQNRGLRGQLEGFYYGTPWATDGTSGRIPYIPWITAGTTDSPHTLENRFQRSETENLQKVLSDPSIAEFMRPENAEHLLQEAQDILKSNP